MAIPQYTKVGIKSNAFGKYVSLNGTGVNQTRDAGWPNTVSTMGHLKSWEIFNLHRNDDGTVSFEASVFPKAYLRLDGTGVTAGSTSDGGTVNAQFGAFGWEKFHIRRTDDTTGIVAIESAAFPGRYLRADSGNKLNVQGSVMGWEKFEIEVVG